MAVSQLLLCLMGCLELAGAASLPSFNFYVASHSELSPGRECGTLFLPIADGATGSRSQVLAGRVWRGLGLGTLPRSLHKSLPGTLRPETAISASSQSTLLASQVGPGRLEAGARGAVPEFQWCNLPRVFSGAMGSCLSPVSPVGPPVALALPSRNPVQGRCCF